MTTCAQCQTFARLLAGLIAHADPELQSTKDAALALNAFNSEGLAIRNAPTIYGGYEIYDKRTGEVFERNHAYHYLRKRLRTLQGKG
jgi:hypothetical protein